MSRPLWFLLVLIFLCSGCQSNRVITFNQEFGNVKTITLYQLKPSQDISEFSNRDFQPTSTKEIKDVRFLSMMNNAEYENKNSIIFKAGMGAIAVNENGESIRIIFSSYGNFFIVPGRKGYFFFKKESDAYKFYTGV